MKPIIGITATDFSGNKGAAAMLQSIIKNLDSNNDTYEFKLFSVYPNEDIKQNPYRNLEVVSCKPEQIIFIAFPLAVLYKLFFWFPPFKWLILKNRIVRSFYSCDIVLDAAGISFVDSRGFIMNTYNFICAATPLLMNTDVVKLSQAMGPFKNPWNRLIAKMVLPKLKQIHARGSGTFEHLMELKLKNVTLSADMAFLMPDSEIAKKQLEEIKSAHSSIFEKDVIGISVSSVVQKYCRKNGIDYEGIITSFVKRLINENYSVFLIANAARINSSKSKNNDLHVGDTIASMINDDANCLWIHEEFSPELIREIISGTKILVGSRFHAMVGALEKSVPTLLIGWSHKYEEVLEMFNNDSYSIDYKCMDEQILFEKFEEITQQYTKIKNTLQEALPSVKQSSQGNFAHINDYLDKRLV